MALDKTGVLTPMGERVGEDFARLRRECLALGVDLGAAPFAIPGAPYDGPSLEWRIAPVMAEPEPPFALRG